MSITIERTRVGMLMNNVYYLSDGESGILVDPSCKPERLKTLLNGRRVDAILLTHYHFDHIGAAAEMRRVTGAPVYASALDAPYIENPTAAPGRDFKIEPCTVDVRVDEGFILRVGASEWRAIMTPGHSPGSMCWLLEIAQLGAAQGDDTADATAGAVGPVVPAFPVTAAGGSDAYAGILISGDTLFEGTFGRTDFEDGSHSDMMRSLARLSELHDDVLVLPGHGEPTTIRAERFCTLR